MPVITNKKAFENISQYLRVLARCQPQDKYILVMGLQA